MGLRTREPGSKHYQLCLSPSMRAAIELKRDEMSEGVSPPLTLNQTITYLISVGLTKR
jgi:hypothetical protein